MKSIWFFNHYAKHPPYGGCIRYHNWAKILVEKGYKVTIFCASSFHRGNEMNMIKDSSLYSTDISDGIEYVYVRARDYTMNNHKRVLNLIDYFFNVLKAIKYFPKPNVIVSRSPNPLACLAGIYAAKKLSIPCISDIVDLWPQSIVEYMDMSEKNIVIRMLYKLEKIIYKSSDAIIFSFEGGSDYIKDKGWDKTIDIKKIHYINMGVDLALFDENSSKYKIDEDTMLRSDIFKVVYCGSVRTANNIKSLCDGAKEILNQGYEDIKFLIHGGGDQVDELINYCAENNISNIKFFGWIEKSKIPYLITHSDINVLNYKAVPLDKYGGSMNKMFEYFASARPILSNQRFGYDLVERYDCGYILPEVNSKEYAKGILWFYNMPKDERNKMGAKGRKAAEDFSQPILVDRLLDVFSFVGLDVK